MDTLLSIVQGNHGFDWNFTLTDSAGVAVNLTGATLTFVSQSASDGTVNSSGAMSIVGSPTLGTCKYTVQANDFLVAGSYTAQINLNYGSGTEIISYAGIDINVIAQLPI